jgi:hypothetical protein
MSKEFIRGNRDGHNGHHVNNETYTVCRLGVSATRFADEMQQGMHRRHVSCPGPCPIHSSADPSGVPYWDHAGDEADLPAWNAKGMASGPREPLEVIHLDGNGKTFTICRLGVERTKLVEEVNKGLHQRYFVKGGFVQGKPSDKLDNVNHPDPPCPLRRIPW